MTAPGTAAPRPSARRMALRLAALLAASMAASMAVSAAACGRAPDERAADGAARARADAPHLVLVVADTLRADHLGLYGYERATAPALRAWARDALVFEAATAPSNRTRPSMHALFTARAPPADVLLREERLPDHEPVLAELLCDAGYATLGVTANPYQSAAYGADRGFDRLVELGWKQVAHEGHWKQPFAAPAVVDAAQALLDARPDDGRPVFLYVHFMDPHLPYDPPEAHRDLLPAGYDGPIDGTLAGYRVLEGPHVDARLPPEDRQAVLSLYDGEIRSLDAGLARLRELVAARLGGRRTVTVVTADHGEAFGTGPLGYYLHGTGLGARLLHVPLVLHGAGASGRVDARVGLVDLAPTLLSLARVPLPDDVDGVPLLDADGRPVAPAGRDFVAYRARRPEPGAPVQQGAGELAVVRDGWQALRDEDGSWRLLDFAADRPVPAEGELAARLADMVAAAERWLARSAERAKGRGAPVPARLPEGGLEQLQALGYVEGAR